MTLIEKLKYISSHAEEGYFTELDDICTEAILEIQRLQLELDRRSELPVYQEAYS